MWRGAGDDPLVIAEQSAAFLQHVFAYQVEESLRHGGRTVKWLSERSGLTPGHLSHVLRGEQNMSVATMAGIVRALDQVELFPAPSGVGALNPPDELVAGGGGAPSRNADEGGADSH